MLTQVINGSNGEVSGLDRLTENRVFEQFLSAKYLILLNPIFENLNSI
jgi:hypothetical protein